MTREFREFWLDISYHLHIHPRDQDRLTAQEWREAVGAIKEIRKEAEKASS